MMIPRAYSLNRRTLLGGVAASLLVSAAGRPAIAGAQGATPAATGESSGLTTMLGLAPASYPWVDDSANLMIDVADIAAQLEVAVVTPPDSVDDAGFSPWTTATFGLAMPMPGLEYLRYWREDYGFDMLQADQTLAVSLPPFQLSLYRGRFDLDLVRATLTANGYTEVETDGHILLSLRDDYEVDVTSPFAYKLAAMNHVALMDDGTIACSSVQVALAAVLDVAAGAAPSLLEEGEFATLVEQAPADAVSGTIVAGTALAGSIPSSLIEVIETGGTPDIDAAATEIAATSEMPPVALLMLYATAGGPFGGPVAPEDPTLWDGIPDGRVGAVAWMLTPEAAEAAVPVVEGRLETGESINAGVPYSDYFADWDVRAVPSQPVLVVDLALAPEGRRDILWLMLSARDLGFLAW